MAALKKTKTKPKTKPKQKPKAPGLPRDVSRLIDKWAKRYGVDPKIAKAQAWQESRGNQKAVNAKSGAVGVMQSMPATAKDLGVNPHNMEDNIKGGMKYMGQLLKTFNGDYNLALAAYNAGPGRVKRAGNQVPKIEETKHDVADIQRNAKLQESQWTRTKPTPHPTPRPTPTPRLAP